MYVNHLITPFVTALVGIFLLIPMGQKRHFNGYLIGYLFFAGMVLFATVFITQRIVERRTVYTHVKLQEERLIQARAVVDQPDLVRPVL